MSSSFAELSSFYRPDFDSYMLGGFLQVDTYNKCRRDVGCNSNEKRLRALTVYMGVYNVWLCNCMHLCESPFFPSCALPVYVQQYCVCVCIMHDSV